VWLFLGIPKSWKVILTIISALGLIVLSIKIVVPKKSKILRPRKKEKVTPVFVENMPILTTMDGVSKPQTDLHKTE